MVQAVLFGEEIIQGRVPCQCGGVKKANITTRTKRTKRALFAHAAQGHSLHTVVLRPGQQHLGQAAHHAQRQSIQGLGTVQGDQAHCALHLGQHITLLN